MKKSIDAIKKYIQARRLEIILLLTVITVYGYFFSCGGWNQNARFDSIFSFVEPGTTDSLTFHIDRFIVNPEKGYNTGDWSFYNGHYYSNKAPGTTLIGISVYAVIFWIEQCFRIPVNHPFIEILNAYLINFSVSVIIVSLGVLFFYKMLILRNVPVSKAVTLTFILAFCTCAFPYSTELWGHTTAMAFIIFALYNIEKRTDKYFMLAGLFCGLAVLTDYLAVFPTITAGCYILYIN
jgi:hypothetical protein